MPDIQSTPEKSIFETVLASTIHDMKNSLGLLMGQLDSITNMLDETRKDHHLALSSVRYETSRLNLSLMQLLTLYKLDKKQLHVAIGEVEVIEFIEDCIAAFIPLAESKNIALNIECDEELIWFFDKNLTGIAINNIIGNCIRYTKTKVLVTAYLCEQMLNFEIIDDGVGYPEDMLNEQGNFIKSVNQSTGSTGLGLFFTETVANLHHRKGRTGSIALENTENGGGLFRLLLP
ncbi:MAG: ATP-binding protein [Gammaproteobacteria bacterium CG22_combo_CG10-13_8_21_14_all_40_8]|nr:MAG: ATP-binding protein [Gammaproteobacteria bacterium CG22_combo_CG10-13_8_21_14_all_40_8]